MSSYPVDLNICMNEIVLCGKICADRCSTRRQINSFALWSNRSKDGVVLSVNEEISGGREKYQIKNKYDLLLKKVDEQDSGRYLCQNFEQVLSMNVILTVLSKCHRVKSL